ncbi:TPA: hypothetical protein ENS27_17500 [bacterium]|nr:hypothetical protein [bacterium]
MKPKTQAIKSKIQNHKEPKTKQKVNLKLELCPLFPHILIIFISIILSSSVLASGTASQINSKARLAIGYDSNVSDKVNDPLKSNFLQLYINSDFNLYPTTKSSLAINIQDGLKYHDAKSLSNESILINSMDLCFTHKITEHLTPDICGEIRSRTSMHSRSQIISSEESYMRGNAGVALKAMIFSDISSRVFLNYKATNFEDFDPFDRRGYEFGCKTNIRLLPNAFINFQYSREKMNFNKWDDEGKLRNDVTDTINVGGQFYKYLLINFNASYENNNSNAIGYSYKGYMASILMAKAISDKTTLELYALFRSRKHESSLDETNSIQIDIEDEERNVFITKISRDIARRVALEIQYDLRRNRSGVEGGTYAKNVFSASILSDF